MKPFILAPLALCVASLAACVTIDVGADTVLFTNRQAERQGWVFTGQPASQAGLGPGFTVEEGSLPAGFGDVHYALVRGAPGRPLIVFCGGNGFREQYVGADRAEALSPYGDVLFFDYPGSGQTGGSGTLREFAKTGEAVLAKAEAELAARGGDRLVFWGHSLGSGVCASLAARAKAPSILVMEAGFANVSDVAKGVAGPLAPAVRTRLEPETLENDIPVLLTSYDQPIVIVASRTDETIPFSTTRRLVQRLQDGGRKVDFIVLPKGRHSTFYQDPDYDPPVRTALAKVGVTRLGVTR